MTIQYPLPLPTRVSMAAEDFLPAASNEAAVRLVLDTPPEEWVANTLLLIGPAGSGKTHLLSIWQEREQAEPATPETLARLATNQNPPCALTLDEAQTVAGDSAREEELQHLYNAAKAAKVPFLLAARTPPGVWGLKLADIASRLKSCPVVTLDEPDDDLMRVLLIKQFADRQLRVDDGVIEYMAKRLERTGRALRDAVTLLDEKALAEGHKISIPFVQAALFSGD